MTKHKNGITPGIYSYGPLTHPVISLLLKLNSDKVWRQGPRGGVKIIKDRFTSVCQYVTNNEVEMKEFMWVKLQSQTVTVN